MKKNLGKIVSIIMVVTMVLSLSACFGKKTVAEFVREEGPNLEAELEKELKATGMECDCEVEADGKDLVVNMKLAMLDSVPTSQKATMQAAFDEMKGELAKSFDDAKKEVSDLENVIYKVTDSKGELWATVDIAVD